MKVLCDIVVSTIVSFEFLVICIVTGLAALFPAMLSKAGTALQSHKDAFQWLSVGCVAVLMFALRLGHEVLVPKHEHSGILASWPGFYMLKNRTLVGVCYVVTGACVAVVTWIFGADISDTKISAVYCASVTIVLIATLSLWYATVQLGIRLRDVRHDNPSN
jgi:hypothetical protein